MLEDNRLISVEDYNLAFNRIVNCANGTQYEKWIREEALPLLLSVGKAAINDNFDEDSQEYVTATAELEMMYEHLLEGYTRVREIIARKVSIYDAIILGSIETGGLWLNDSARIVIYSEYDICSRVVNSLGDIILHYQSNHREANQEMEKARSNEVDDELVRVLMEVLIALRIYYDDIVKVSSKNASVAHDKDTFDRIYHQNAYAPQRTTNARKSHKKQDNDASHKIMLLTLGFIAMIFILVMLTTIL